MAFVAQNTKTNSMDTKRLFGDIPDNYHKNQFPDKYSRYRFYSAEKLPLSIKTQRLVSPVYCSKCGSVVSSNSDLHECVACKQPLCDACNNGGLCAEHFNQLNDSDKKILLKNAKRKIKTFTSNFVWGIMGIPLFFGGFFGGVFTENWVLLGLSIPGSLFLMMGLPFLMNHRDKKKEKSMKKKIIPILRKVTDISDGPMGQIGSYYSRVPPSSNTKGPRYPQYTNTYITENKNLLEKFKKVLKISDKIKIKDVASLLNLSESELLNKLLEWGEFLPFKIDDDLIVVEDVDAFINELDKQFDDWEVKETYKYGKKM